MKKPPLVHCGHQHQNRLAPINQTNHRRQPTPTTTATMSQMKTIFLLLMFLSIEVSSIVDSGKQNHWNQWNGSRPMTDVHGSSNGTILNTNGKQDRTKLIEDSKIGTTTEINGLINLKFEISTDWPNETETLAGNGNTGDNSGGNGDDDDVGDILENNNNNNGTKNASKSDWSFVINWSNYSYEHGPPNVSNIAGIGNSDKRQPPIVRQQKNVATNINNKKKKKKIGDIANMGQISAGFPPFSINNNGIDSPTKTTMIKVNYTKLDQNDNEDEHQYERMKNGVLNNNDINNILDGGKFNESEQNSVSASNQNKTSMKSGHDGVRIQNENNIELSLQSRSQTFNANIDETNQWSGSRTELNEVETSNMAQNNQTTSSFTMAPIIDVVSSLNKNNVDDNETFAPETRIINDRLNLFDQLNSFNNSKQNNVHQINIAFGNKTTNQNLEHNDDDDDDGTDQIEMVQQQSANVGTSEPEHWKRERLTRLLVLFFYYGYCSSNGNESGQSSTPSSSYLIPVTDLNNIFYSTFRLKPIEYHQYESSSVIKRGCVALQRKQRSLDGTDHVVHGNEIQNNDDKRIRGSKSKKRIDSNSIRSKSNEIGNDKQQPNQNQNQNLEHPMMNTTVITLATNNVDNGKNNDKNNLVTGTRGVPEENNSKYMAKTNANRQKNKSGTSSSVGSTANRTVGANENEKNVVVDGNNEKAPNEIGANVNMFVQDLTTATATTETAAAAAAAPKTIQNRIVTGSSTKTKTMTMMNRNSNANSDEIKILINKKNTVVVVDSNNNNNKTELHLTAADDKNAESNIGDDLESNHIDKNDSGTFYARTITGNQTTNRTEPISAWSAKIEPKNEKNHTHHSGFWNENKNDDSTGNATNNDDDDDEDGNVDAGRKTTTTTTTSTLAIDHDNDDGDDDSVGTTMIASKTSNDGNNGNSPNNNNNNNKLRNGNNINDDDDWPEAMQPQSSNSNRNGNIQLKQQNRVNGGSFQENRSSKILSTTITTKTATIPLDASKANHSNNSNDVKYRIWADKTNNDDTDADVAVNNMTNLHYNSNQSKSLPSSSLPSTTATVACKLVTTVNTEGNITDQHRSTLLLLNRNSVENVTNNNNHDDDDSMDARRQVASSYCPSETDQHDIVWPVTDSGILSIQPCPMKAYYGTMFRLCHGFNSNNNNNNNNDGVAAVWMQPDLTECRLTKLRELHYLVNQHSRKHLVDGLFLLVVELKNLIVKQTIHSPMDQMDSFALLNTILHHMVEHKIRFDRFDSQQQRTVVRFIQSVIIITDRLLERINHNVYRNNDPVIAELLQLITSIRLLMDNVLRAFILACQDGTIANLNEILQQNHHQPFFPETKNIGVHLRYQRQVEPKQLITLIETNRTVDYRDVCKTISSDPTKPFGTGASDSNLPSIISLNGVNEMDVGITEIRLLNSFWQPINNRLMINDHILSISLVPAVSIQVNFEVTPCFEVMFQFSPENHHHHHHHQQQHSMAKNKLTNQNPKPEYDQTLPNIDMIQCARLMISHRKQPVWMVDSGCRTASFNGTHLRCWCKESGLIAAAAAAVSRSWSTNNMTTDNHNNNTNQIQQPHGNTDNDNVYDNDDDGIQPSTMMTTIAAAAAVAYRHNMARIIRSSGFHLSPGTMAPSSHHILYDIVLYTSLVASVLFYSLTLVIQYQLRHYETRETFFIIRNLIIALLLIQLTFLLGTTIHMDLFWIRVEQLSNGFPPTTWSNQIKHILCLSVPIFLHFIHLASMFWMLSHTILLYQRMWRKYNKISQNCDEQTKMLQKKHHDRNRFNDKMMLLNELGVHSHECRKKFLKKLKEQQPPELDQENGIAKTKQCSSILKRIRRKLFKHPFHSTSTNTKRKQQSLPFGSKNVSKINVMQDGTAGKDRLVWFPTKSKLMIKHVRQLIDCLGHFIRSIFNTWHCAHYLCVSLGFPFIFVLLSYLLNPKGYETKRYCWMSIEGGIQYSFIMPVLLLISLNTCLILLVLKRYFERKPLSNRIQIHQIRPSIRACIILLPFFCLNWFLGVLSLETLRTTPFELIFALTNGMHSFMAFYFHCYQRYNLKHHLQQYGCINGKIYKFSQKYSSSIYRWWTGNQNDDRMFAENSQDSNIGNGGINLDPNDEVKEPDEGNMFLNQYDPHHGHHHHHHHHHPQQQHNRNDNGSNDDGDNDPDDDDDDDNADDIDLEQKRISQSDEHEIIVKDDPAVAVETGDPTTMVIIEKSSMLNSNSSNNGNNGDTVGVLSSTSNLMCCCNDLVYGGQCPYQCPTLQAQPAFLSSAQTDQNNHSFGFLNRSSSFPNLNHPPEQQPTSDGCFDLHHHHPPSHFLLTSTATADTALGDHHHHHHGQHHCFCCQHINDDNNGNDSRPESLLLNGQPQHCPSSNGCCLHHHLSSGSSPTPAQPSASSSTAVDYYYSLDLGKNFQVIPEYDPTANSDGTSDRRKIDSFGTVQQGQRQQQQQQWKNPTRSFPMNVGDATTKSIYVDNNAKNYDGENDDGPKRSYNKMEPVLTMTLVDEIHSVHRRPKMIDCFDGHDNPQNPHLLEDEESRLSKIDFTLPSRTDDHLSHENYNTNARIMLSPMDFEDEDEDLIIIEIEDDDDEDDDEDEDTDEILESDYDHEMAIADDDKIIF